MSIKSMIPSNHLILCCPLLPLPSIFPSIRVFSNESARWERLTKLKLGLVLMGGAMLSKYLIPCSVDGWSCVPSLLFTWDQTMVEVMKIVTLTATNPAAGHHQPMPPLETPGDSWANLGQSLMESLLLFLCPGAHKVLRVLQESISQSCVSSGIYGGVNGDLIHEGLCHTQVCCTQSPCSCGSLPPTHTSTGDAQTQFCLSLCGVPESWCTQGFV